MIHSMTGFARREHEAPWGRLSCEVRTVNHRYLETSLRLPEELRAVEADLRRLVSDRLRRGKVDCSFRLVVADKSGESLELDPGRLDAVVRTVESIRDRTSHARKVDPMDILRWPGVLVEPESPTEPLQAAARTLLGETLAAVAEMRAAEGARIRVMLLERCDQVETLATQVRARLPTVLENLRTRLRDRVAEIVADADPERLEQEIAMLAQKMDVDEELDRLQSHVHEARNALDRDEAVGRRLDFLMQEFNREANTLGSKSQDQETTRLAVELKVVIEQMREQVQNVE